MLIFSCLAVKVLILQKEKEFKSLVKIVTEAIEVFLLVGTNAKDTHHLWNSHALNLKPVKI